jgi:predicted Zn-dependent peptidase
VRPPESIPVADPAASRVRRSVLHNGVTILTEEMPHVRTAAFAVYLKQGSRDEETAESGLSHFLEHFVFRGTVARRDAPARSPRDIAVETDLLGGDVDAWTDRESTCYSVEVAADLLPRAMDLVMDLVARPSLTGAELERERSVIREEIRGIEEDSEELAFDLAAGLYWPAHPLGRPVQGTIESVDAFTADVVAAFWRKKHVGSNLLVCAAGRLTHDDIVEAVRAGLGELPAAAPHDGPPAPPAASGRVIEQLSHLEQAHVVLSLPGLACTDPEMPVMAVLATALGGGMSSRLWQRIREDEGLAYDVSLGHEALRDCGRLSFHAVTSPEHVARTLAIYEEEVGALRAQGLSSDELERVKQGLRSGMVLGQEGPGERLGELAWGELVHGRHLTLDDRLARLAGVTVERAASLAHRILADDRRILVVVTPDAKSVPG